MKSKFHFRRAVKVARNGRQHHCPSCIDDCNDGFGYVQVAETPDPRRIGDVCCCVHGSIVGRQQQGEYLAPFDERV